MNLTPEQFLKYCLGKTCRFVVGEDGYIQGTLCGYDQELYIVETTLEEEVVTMGVLRRAVETFYVHEEQ
ncbi:hypothetical protein [Xanthomonas phage JGB6]|nr:hypothetical protein [Xanthomonas phage JGB6]